MGTVLGENLYFIAYMRFSNDDITLLGDI